MDRTATCVPTAVDAPSSTSLSLSAPLSTSAPVVLPHTAIPAAPGHTLPQPSPPLPLPPQQQHPLKPQHQPQHQPQQQEQPQHGSQRHTDQGSSDDRVATRAAPPRPPRRRHVIASRRSSRARTSSPDHCHSAASGRPADGGDAVACEAGGASDNTNKRVSAGGQLHAMKPTRTRTKANTPAPSKRRHVSAPLLPFRRPTSTVFRLRKELGLASCRLSARIGGGGGGGGGGVGSHAHTVSDGAATASATVVVANTASVGPPGGHNNVSGHAGKGAMGDRSSSSAAAPKAVGAGATSVLSAGKHVGKWLWSSSETLRSRRKRSVSAVQTLQQRVQGGEPEQAKASVRTHPDDASMASEVKVGDVSHVQHTTQVRFNAKLARFEGLPPGWESSNQQFGVPLATCPKNADAGYGKAIPAVVVLLAHHLLDAGGLREDGIFRRAASKALVDTTKRQVNEGTYTTCDDAHVLATLLKVWFRELPPNLLDDVKEQTMVQVLDGESTRIDSFFGEWDKPKAQLLLWLLDLQAQFVMNHEHNRMTAKNMAIVWAPNLVTVDAAADPMQAIVRSRIVCKFLRKLLEWRLATKFDWHTAGGTQPTR